MALPTSPSPTSRFGMIVLGVGVALILGMFWFLKHLSDQPRHRLRKPVPNATASPGATAATPAPTPAVPAVDPQAVATVGERMSQALAVLKDSGNPNKAEALAALRKILREAEPRVAIAAIREFLASGQDAPTGLGFRIGDGHTLDAAPSMRTFLMDELGTISQGIGAGDAAEIAREILATKGSADEWAVALRNVGWADPEGSKGFLAEKARELINHAPWQQAPSGGYMEAFDAAAFSGDASLMKDLAPLSDKPSGVQKAALVALQRLSGMAPGKVAAYLNANPDVLAEAPMRRADYMGSVNLTDPAQLTQAETYLNRTDVTEAEKTKFLGRLGVPAGFVSETLLTPETIVNMPVMEQRALVNKVANGWLAANKFPALQDRLKELIANTQPLSPGP